jgi:hypothetical protein
MMLDFDATFYYVDPQITPKTFVEVPARGPEKVNCLVIVSGVVFCNLDTDSGGIVIDVEPGMGKVDIVPHPQPGAGDTRPYQGNLTVHTGYLLNLTDQWTDIAQNNPSLRHTAYVTLAYINSEDEAGGEFTCAVDAAHADMVPLVPDEPRSPNELVVFVQVGLGGDATLVKLFYQVHLLLYRPPTP